MYLSVYEEYNKNNVFAVVDIKTPCLIILCMKYLICHMFWNHKILNMNSMLFQKSIFTLSQYYGFFAGYACLY